MRRKSVDATFAASCYAFGTASTARRDERSAVLQAHRDALVARGAIAVPLAVAVPIVQSKRPPYAPAPVPGATETNARHGPASPADAREGAPRSPKGFRMLHGRHVVWMSLLFYVAANAQVPPTTAERRAYGGLFAAADAGNAADVARLAAAGADVNARDGYGRTPLHVAAYARRHDAMRALAKAGANPNALERDRYDIVTIAAVADDAPTLDVALAIGGSARNVTSRYDGTALIAAAHLGHDGVVRTLIRAGAPLDHVNNLGWTAVIESIVLGNGGPRHVATLKALVDAGADVNLADRNGATPLALARGRGYGEMVAMLQRAGGR